MLILRNYGIRFYWKSVDWFFCGENIGYTEYFLLPPTFQHFQITTASLFNVVVHYPFHPNILWHYDLPNNWPYGIIVSSVKQSILNLSSFLENSFMIRQHLLNLYPEKLLNMRVSVCQRPVMIMLAVGWKVIISK